MDQRRRVLIAGAVGTATATFVGFRGPWILAALAGWDAAALALHAFIWPVIGRFDAEETRLVATREDDSRTAVDIVVIGSSVASLVGVLIGLAAAKEYAGAFGPMLTIVSVLTVVISWLIVHTMFVLRYAHLYYSIGGGIDFPDPSEPPDYRDFIYVAFTLGMTYQISDTPLSHRTIRRTAARHALLSYLFGTVIIGVTINVVGSLI